MLDVRLANLSELDAVMNLYYETIEIMADQTYQPGWVKDVYPTRDNIRRAIEQEELYVAYWVDPLEAMRGRGPVEASEAELPWELQERPLVGVMVLNHAATEGYETVDWPTEAKPSEVCLIHALGIHPHWQQRGIGKQLVAAAADISRAKGAKALRLDVLKSNIPAQKLYPALGFQYVTTLKLFYDNTGLTEFLLYELAL